HPYGHGKAESIASIIVSMLLLGAALLIAAQSVREIMTPHQAPHWFTLPVLLVVIAIKETMFRLAYKAGSSIASTALKSDAWHHRSDALTSAAAFLGISIALIGGAGYESADDWAALIASTIIAYNAYRLFIPAINEVMDTSPPAEVEMAVRNIAQSVHGVIGLDKCYVRKMGFDYYVDLHVIVSGMIPVREGHRIGHEVKNAICTADSRIADVLIHIEPDIFDK
ncbi:cation transporter, partial [bacterium]|nr:cation transporter [bacterium]